MADAIVSGVLNAVVSGALNKLGEFIFTQAKEKFDLFTGLETEIHNLFNTLKRIQAVLDDAEKRKLKDKIVELWLHDLEDISYEIDDVIDEWNYLIRKEEIEGPSWLTRVCSFIPFSCFLKVRFVRPDIAVNVKKLNERLDSIEREKNRFSFITSSAIASSSQKSKRFQSISLLNVSQVIGRDSELDTLVSQLLDERHEEEKNIIKILSIVGTGGIGKTTLAQLAYNDARVNGQFEKKGWVCFSNTFDEIRVAKAIVESLESSPVPNLDELDSLLQLVKKSTSGKRFLLVLDDVWLEDQMAWEPFKNSLNFGAPGSRILLTTRNKKVATNAGAISSMIELDIMSPSDSWSLFHQIAFVGPNATRCERLENIGMEIAEKCKGLPLAIKVIASFLSSKNNVEYWLNVKDSELWKLEVTNVGVFPHLYLSYNDLSPVLRHCFSYCAVFPKGQLIDVDYLIRCWIVLGYLKSSESEDKMEVEGRDYFEILVSRLFFVQCTKDNDERIMSCRMHDMVHDFALHLTKRERLVIEGSKVVTCCEKPRHVTWLRSDLKAIDTLPECNMGQARSFVRETSYATLETVATKSLMNSLKLVRLLDLSRCSLELPTEIGNLIHLRYLSLSYNYILKELPATVYNLYNLHTLKLNDCWQLKELPPGIEKLKKLRHLIVGEVKFPMGIEELTCLQTLSCFSIGKEYNKLGYLKNLNQLRGSLRVWIMDDLEDAIDARNANLKSKKHIQSLEFRIENSSRVTEDVIKALEPHPKLQKLKFYSYGETELPPWMTSLNDLVELGLYCCIRLTALPPLGILPSLETLQIDTLPRSKFEDYAFWARRESFRSPAMAFPKLKILEFGHGDFEDLDFLDSNEKEEAEWEKWEAHEPPLNLQILTVELYGRSQLPMWMTSLNNLKKLSLNDCFNLISLLPLGILPSLERLEFYRCEQLKFVGAAFLGIRESLPSPAIGFPKLEELEFNDCEKLEEWEDISAEDVEDNTVSLMPCLQRLIIDDCPNLQTLPHRLLHKASSLSCIMLDEEEYNPSIFLLIASTLAEVPNHQSTSTEEGPQVKPIHPALHPLLYSNDEGVLKDACLALSYFLSHVTYGKAMIEAGVSQGIVELLRHRSPRVLIPALVVEYILSKNDARIQCIIDNDILPRLLSLLTNNSEESGSNMTARERVKIQFDAAQALRIIAPRISEKRKVLTDLGVVPILVKLLRSPSNDVREQVVLTLRTFAGDSSECRDLVLGHGALLPLLLQLSEDASHSMGINFTWILCEFFKHKLQPQFEQVKPTLVVLRRLIYSHDEKVLCFACWAIFYLISGTGYKIQTMIEDGVCQRFAELLHHPSPVLNPVLRTIGVIARGDNAQSQCIIDNDVLPRLLSLLTNNSEKSSSNMTARERVNIQFHAARALGIIASRISEKRKVLTDLRVVPILIKLLHSPTNDVREQVVIALGIFAGDSPECRDLVLEHGALMPLLLQLSEDAKLSMQINATWTLCEFFKHKSQPQFEQVKPALVVLRRLIYSNDEKVLYFACWALFYLVSGTGDKIQTMIEDSVFQRFAELIYHPSHVLNPVLRTIGVIARGDNAQIQCVIDNDILSRLLSLLTNNSEESSSNMTARERVDIQFHAARAFGIIASKISEKRKVLTDLGVVPILVKLLRPPTNDVHEQVVLALGIFAGDSPECRDLVLGQGALMPLLLQLSEDAKLSMQIHATRTLCEFFKHKSQPQFEQVKPALVVLRRLIFSNDEKVLYFACSALFYLVRGMGDNSQIMIEDSVCQRFAELLYHASPVLDIVLQTIGFIVRGDNAQTQCVIDNDILPRLLSLLINNSEESSSNMTTRERVNIQFHAARALRIIASKISEKRKVLTDLGVVPILVKLLRSPTNDVREQVVLALGMFAGDSPECRDLVLGHGALMPLLLQLSEDAKLSMQINATWTLCEFFKHKLQPQFEQVKPALVVLRRLIYSHDEEVLRNACLALSFLISGTGDKIQTMIKDSICQRFAELLHHPSLVLDTVLRKITFIVGGDNAQTQCVIDNDILHRLLSLLTNNSEGSRSNMTARERVDIQFHAAQAFGIIAHRISEKRKVLTDLRVVPILVKLLRSPTNDVREQAVIALGIFAGDSLECRDLVLEHGALMPLLLQLSEDAKLSMQIHATRTLCEFFKHKSRPQFEQVKPTLVVLRRLIYSNDEKVLYFACWGLFYLVRGMGDNSQIMIEDSVCQRFAELLYHASPVLDTVLQTIGFIVRGDNAQTQCIIDNNILPRLLSLLTNNSEESSSNMTARERVDIQFHAARALGIIAHRISEKRKVLTDLRVVPILVKLLRSPTNDVREQAVIALGIFAGDSLECRDLVLEHGALMPLLLQLSEDAKLSMQIHATRTLCEFFKHISRPQFEQVKPTLVVLRRLIYSNDEKVLYFACWGLFYLVRGMGDNSQIMIEDSVCQRFAELLYHASPVLDTVLQTIGFIVRGDNAQTQCIIDNNILPRLLSLLTNNSEESSSNMTARERVDIQFHAARALGIIAHRISEKRKVLTDLRVVPILVKLLRSPTNDVREQAVIALGIFAGDSPECRDLVLEHGALMPLLLQLSENAKLSMQIHATRTLCEFFKHKLRPQFEQVKPTLVVLCRLIYSNDENVLYFACWGLFYLVRGMGENSQIMIEDSVCQRFAELLHHPYPVLNAVLRTIGMIVRGVNAQTQVVIEAGLIAPLVNLLQTAEYNIKNGAAWAIVNAICSGTHEQIKFMASEVCIKSLCDHLVSPDPWLIITILCGLEKILKVGEVEKNMGNSGDVNYFAQLIEKAEGLEKIKNLQFHDDIEVKLLQNHLQTYWLGDEDETLP